MHVQIRLVYSIDKLDWWLVGTQEQRELGVLNTAAPARALVPVTSINRQLPDAPARAHTNGLTHTQKVFDVYMSV